MTYDNDEQKIDFRTNHDELKKYEGEYFILEKWVNNYNKQEVEVREDIHIERFLEAPMYKQHKPYNIQLFY